MQSSSFLCKFICSVLLDYQYINPYKQALHTKHNDFCIKFIYSVRTQKGLHFPYTTSSRPLKNKKMYAKNMLLCKAHLFYASLYAVFCLIINILTLINRHCIRSITILSKNSSIACARTHTRSERERSAFYSFVRS